MGGKIKNFDAIAVTPARKAALEIVEAGLFAIDTEQAIQSRVSLKDDTLKIDDRSFDVGNFDRIFVVGVGKCSLEAGRALENVLGDRLSGGIVLDVHRGVLKKIKAYSGTHPFPTEANVDATSEIIRLLSSLTEKDFVVFVISGGGSTLLCQPQNMVCAEEAEILKVLFEKGATIEEINTLRKHLSLARGGRLAEYAYPASSVALIFSDVPGDNLGFIASGPTVKDATTVDEAKTIVAKYDLEKSTGLKIEPLKTPKEDKYFEKVKNILFISNATALGAMKEKADTLGFEAEVVTATLSGEARDVGRKIAGDTAGLPPKTARLYGGETTVTVKKSGRGGRNQELVLGALGGISEKTLVLSFDSDGHDNQGGYAGAFCDIMTKEKAEELGLEAGEFLENNDSAAFFEKAGDSIETGDTGSNVSDLVIALRYE